MGWPYRDPAPPAEDASVPIIDPVRAAQAEVLREIAAGIRTANERYAKADAGSDYSASAAYQTALRALQDLHEEVLRKGAR